MKRILFILFAGLLLTACSEETAAPVKQEEATVVEESTGPTQEELNAQIKAEAVQVDFVKANAEEYNVGDRLTATGEVSFKDEINFTLTTDEGDGSGMYLVTYANTTDFEFADGDMVTIYGSYYGKDPDLGMPKLTASVIE